MGNLQCQCQETRVDEDGVIKIFDQDKKRYRSCDTIKLDWPANLLPNIKDVPQFKLPLEGPDPIYGIENLVFEGGGVKGLAYAGAIQVLQEFGVIRHVKRIAGASVGSIVAMALAVDYSVDKLVELMKTSPLEEIFRDGDSWASKNIPGVKPFQIAHRVLNNFGVHPGLGAFDWLGKLLKDQTGSADVTFSQVYERYGRELCVVVGNSTLGRPEWFHTKTHPNFPIRRAVRMSMSLPFFFEPWREHVGDTIHLFTDGGIYCNYPIHVWDGWLLSLAPEDAYHRKLPEITDPLDLTSLKVFSPPSNRTLGFKVYDDLDVTDMGRFWGYTYRLGDDAMPSDAESKLAKRYRKLRQDVDQNANEVGAYKKLMKNVIEMMGNKDRPSLTREEFISIVPNELDGEKIFSSMDLNADKSVNFDEVEFYLGQEGYNWRSEIGGNSCPKEIECIQGLATQLFGSLSHGNYRRWYRDSDAERTISIDIRYISTTDFNMKEADKKYCLESGNHAVKCWAKDVKIKSNEEKKENENKHEETTVTPRDEDVTS